jgi:hypothetical protein
MYKQRYWRSTKLAEHDVPEGDMPMDATTWTEGEYTNRSSELTGKSLGENPGPITHDTEVSVVILYTDPVIAAGLTAVLQKHAGFKIVPAGQAGTNIGWTSPATDVIVADYETGSVWRRAAHNGRGT